MVTAYQCFGKLRRQIGNQVQIEAKCEGDFVNVTRMNAYPDPRKESVPEPLARHRTRVREICAQTTQEQSGATGDNPIDPNDTPF